MSRVELVGVNREMSIIKIKKIDDNGDVYVHDVDLNNISKDEFLSLYECDIVNLNEDFLAEVDIMMDEASNVNVREDYSDFLIIRDRFINKFLLNSF